MKKFLLVAAVAGCWIPAAVQALDSGDLVFPSDFTDRVRWEARYENLRRDIQITSESPRADSGVNADVFALRLQTGFVPNARLDFEVGGLDTGTGSYTPMFGAGLRYLAFDHGPWRAGAFAQAFYLPKVEDRQFLYGTGDARVEHDWMEANAGALLSYRFRLADQFALVPYAGPVFSLARLSGEVQDTVRAGDDYRAKENQFFGAALGLSLEAQGVNGLRAELRLFDDVSLSVAAAFVF